jgi:uncharacterized protein with ATP-grasp and redox domains
MKIFLDCVPCFIKQALNASRMATTDPGVHEAVLREVLRMATDLPFTNTPPLLGREIHRVIRDMSGNPDPYQWIKQWSNREALALYEGLKKRVRESERPYETAVRLAVAGNIIDFGPASRPEDICLEQTIEETLSRKFAIDDISQMQEETALAKRIFYLTDNAGEIVFDRILIEELPTDRVTVGVRGLPVINDATMEDAEATGLTGIVDVVDSGADVPGTSLGICSENFMRHFDEADLVIAKGQGNYETLSNIGRKSIFFLLKTKCRVLAKELGCEEGDIAVKRAER